MSQTDEIALYNEYVSLLRPEISLTESDCKRFLRARKWNVQQAVGMTEKWWVWWNTVLSGTDGLTPATILKNIDDPNEDVYRKLMPHSNCSSDYSGRPVYWEQTGDISTRFSEVIKHLKINDLVVRHIRQQELMMRRLEYASQQQNTPIEKQVIVMNLKNLSYAIDTNALSTFKQTLMIDQDYYPERLHCLFMINAPWFFTTIWAMIKPWIDPVTAEKFIILGSDYIETLREHIDDSQIPPDFSGSCDSFTWTWPFPATSGCSRKQIKAYISKQDIHGNIHTATTNTSKVGVTGDNAEEEEEEEEGGTLVPPPLVKVPPPRGRGEVTSNGASEQYEAGEILSDYAPSVDGGVSGRQRYDDTNRSHIGIGLNVPNRPLTLVPRDLDVAITRRAQSSLSSTSSSASPPSCSSSLNIATTYLARNYFCYVFWSVFGGIAVMLTFISSKYSPSDHLYYTSIAKNSALSAVSGNISFGGLLGRCILILLQYSIGISLLIFSVAKFMLSKFQYYFELNG